MKPDNIKNHLALLNLLTLLIFLLISGTGCDKTPSAPGLSKPLVLRDGILFKDSLSTVPYTGRHKSRMLDQTIEYEVKDGIRNGEFIVYFPDGKVQMKGNILNNHNTGEWKYFRTDGSLETSGTFVNDTASGKWSWYYQNGKLAEEGDFTGGKRDGEWKNYDTSGALLTIINYNSGEVVDTLKQY